MKLCYPLSLALMIGCCLVSCNKDSDDTTNENALVIKPAKAIISNVHSVSKDGTVVYPIGSVFVGGGISGFDSGASYKCYFYREMYTVEPEEYESLIVYLSGFWHNGVEYTVPGQQLDLIAIRGLDPSLGLGTKLDIPLNQGVYEGGNVLIREVIINSLKSSTSDNLGTLNKDADINIIIHTTVGDLITIRYVNDITYHRGMVNSAPKD